MQSSGEREHVERLRLKIKSQNRKLTADQKLTVTDADSNDNYLSSIHGLVEAHQLEMAAEIREKLKELAGKAPSLPPPSPFQLSLSHLQSTRPLLGSNHERFRSATFPREGVLDGDLLVRFLEMEESTQTELLLSSCIATDREEAVTVARELCLTLSLVEERMQ